jgi:hypothetical protein
MAKPRPIQKKNDREILRPLLQDLSNQKLKIRLDSFTQTEKRLKNRWKIIDPLPKKFFKSKNPKTTRPLFAEKLPPSLVTIAICKS